jgi:hypothetical protein
VTHVFCNTVAVGRRNVTITLDEETARWARLEAARRDTSVSSLIGELLREHLDRAREYEAAMANYRSREPAALRVAGARYPTREELHDRSGMR